MKSYEAMEKTREDSAKSYRDRITAYEEQVKKRKQELFTVEESTVISVALNHEAALFWNFENLPEYWKMLHTLLMDVITKEDLLQAKSSGKYGLIADFSSLDMPDKKRLSTAYARSNNRTPMHESPVLPKSKSMFSSQKTIRDSIIARTESKRKIYVAPDDSPKDDNLNGSHKDLKSILRGMAKKKESDSSLSTPDSSRMDAPAPQVVEIGDNEFMELTVAKSKDESPLNNSTLLLNMSAQVSHLAAPNVNKRHSLVKSLFGSSAQPDDINILIPRRKTSSGFKPATLSPPSSPLPLVGSPVKSTSVNASMQHTPSLPMSLMAPQNNHHHDDSEGISFVDF